MQTTIATGTYSLPVETINGERDWLNVDVRHIDTRRYPGAFSSLEPTPYQQSDLSRSPIAEAAAANPNRLFNPREPYYALKREKMEHRIVIFLKAEGLTNKEIAEQTGLTTVSVSNILRQPWAQTQVLQIIHQNGGDAVRKLLNDAAVDAVQRLITEMDNEKARPSERIVAADKVLDRLYGKPNQPIEHRAADLSTLSDEELEAIARRGRESGGTSPDAT